MKRGVTLIELLVALAIATLVGYIAFDLVRDEQGNYTKTRNKVRLQADARDAIRIIEEDMANLGFRAGLRYQNGNLPTGFNLDRVCNIKGTSNPVLRADQRLIVIDDNGDSSDIVEGRFFRVSPSDGVLCDSTPIRVRYLVRNNQLIRQFWRAGDSINIRNDAVVLDNVLTLQAQVATDTLLTSQNASWQLKNHPLDDPRVTSSSTNASTLTQSRAYAYNGGDSIQEWNGWTTSTLSLESGAGGTLMPTAKYRLSCLLEMNKPFLDAFRNLTDTGSLVLYLRNNGSWIDSINVRIPSIPDVPLGISWEFQPHSITSSSTIQFVLRSRLATPDPTALLRVGAIHVRRMSGDPTDDPRSNKPQWYWRDAIRDTPAKDSIFRTQAEGLKLWLVARSKRGNKEANPDQFQGIGNWDLNGTKPAGSNTYAVYQRIIPVVNHGY